MHQRIRESNFKSQSIPRCKIYHSDISKLPDYEIIEVTSRNDKHNR